MWHGAYFKKFSLIRKEKTVIVVNKENATRKVQPKFMKVQLRKKFFPALELATFRQMKSKRSQSKLNA